MAQAQRLYGWTAQELDALAQRVAGTWARWLADWGAAADGQAVCTAAQAGDAATHWLPCAADGERRAWLAADVEVGDVLFGQRPEGKAALASQLAGAAAADLRASLAACLGMVAEAASSPGAPPPLGAWSGTVRIDLVLPGHALRLMVNAAGVASLVAAASPSRTAAPQAAPLVPLHSAASGQTVRLKVALSPCELDLGELQGLCVGDVLRLPHPLDAPAHVTAPDGTPVCEAYLGCHGSRKAIELVRTAI